MRKIALPIILLLALLLLGSTGLADSPGKVWWTEFTSGVFTWPDEGTYTYTYESQGGAPQSFTVEVTQDAPEYQGTVLLRPWSIRVRIGEPGLSCADVYVEPRIRPGQPVRFHVAWLTDETMSHKDAVVLLDSLSYTVSWDDGVEMMSLARQAIRPDDEHIDLYDMTCLWTVRR